MRPLHRIFALAMVLGVTDGVAAPQTGTDSSPGYQSGKSRFAGAVVQLMGASAGTYGDESSQIRSSLDAMQNALDGWDAAIAKYEAAVRARPESVDNHVALAAVYLDRGRVEDALAELAAAIRIESARPELHFLQGLAYELLSKPAEAVTSFNRAAALDPGEPNVFYELSLQLQILGRVETALEVDRHFQSAARARLWAPGRIQAMPFTRPALLDPRAAIPVFPLARYSDGAALLRRGDYAKAIDEFRRAVASDPLITAAADIGNGAAQVREGSAALRRGSLREALQLLQAAAESAPASTETHRRLGMAYWADERYDQSAEQLRQAIALSPQNERARLALADVLVTAGLTTEAERVLLDTIDVLPASSQARFRLGRLYHSLERYPEAVHALEQAASLGAFVGLDGLYRIIGLTEALQQNANGAIDAYRHEIAANPNDPAAHRALADTLRDVDRYDEALTEYLAALLVDPRDGAAFTAVATIHLQRQQYADAVASARRALELDADNKQAQYTFATALVRMGRTDEGAAALRVFQRLQEATESRDRRIYEVNALRRQATLSRTRGDLGTAIARLQEAVGYDPDDSGLQVDLGLALLEAHRPEDAIPHFTRALQLDSNANVHRQLAEAYDALGRDADRQRQLELYERQKAERLQRGVFR